MLRSVRQNLPPKVECPALDQGHWICYEDRVKQFTDVLEAVGGTCSIVHSMDELNDQLHQLPAYCAAKKICSCVPGVGESNVPLETIQDPHDLEDVDFAILPGQFGVAENGAVWITDAEIKYRILCFIPQHIALVVRAKCDLADAIVDHMHEAYHRLEITDSSFGLFMSGPSKTADIEQSLVIGAHGPRSLTVFLLEMPN
ncbi:MAG: LUD domain-containing protein [Pirellulales bacterium]|nr:LUD domain-containing protein [Pirellulales bacterium]